MLIKCSDRKNLSGLNDNTKIIRFLDHSGIKKSVGDYHSNSQKVYFTFHFGLLEFYRKYEGYCHDSDEGSIQINYGGESPAKDTYTNDVLVSCWSVWDGDADPWVSFSEGAVVTESNNKYAIVSTIGKVENIFLKIIEINKDAYKKCRYPIIEKKDGLVTYYKNSVGIDKDNWENITNYEKHGILNKSFRQIFYKRDSNEQGQRYDVEKEYRFAIILNPMLFMPEESSSIAMNASDFVLRDYKLCVDPGNHYIEQVYIHGELPSEIKATCYITNIETIVIADH